MPDALVAALRIRMTGILRRFDDLDIALCPATSTYELNERVGPIAKEIELPGTIRIG